MRVCVTLAPSRRQLEEGIAKSGRILRWDQHRAGVILDCFD
jgi:hypothetical protein